MSAIKTANIQESTAEVGASPRISYLLGMAKVKGSVKSLLDIDGVLSTGAELVAALAGSGLIL